jgi:hypothetical protein
MGRRSGQVVPGASGRRGARAGMLSTGGAYVPPSSSSSSSSPLSCKPASRPAPVLSRELECGDGSGSSRSGNSESKPPEGTAGRTRGCGGGLPMKDSFPPLGSDCDIKLV